jgi:hypothetical protein
VTAQNAVATEEEIQMKLTDTQLVLVSAEVREALKELSAIQGQPPRRIIGAGPDTMDKLEARGFVRTVEETSPDTFRRTR